MQDDRLGSCDATARKALIVVEGVNRLKHELDDLERRLARLEAWIRQTAETPPLPACNLVLVTADD